MGGVGSLVETRVEYRALIQSPWTYGSDPKLPKGKPILKWGDYLKKKNGDAYWEIARSVETHAFIVKWQKRTVTVGDWEDDE